MSELVKKDELIERLKKGEILSRYFRNKNTRAFYIGSDRAHGAGAKQLIESGDLVETRKAWHIEYTWKA